MEFGRAGKGFRRSLQSFLSFWVSEKGLRRVLLPLFLFPLSTLTLEPYKHLMPEVKPNFGVDSLKPPFSFSFDRKKRGELVCT